MICHSFVACIESCRIPISFVASPFFVWPLRPVGEFRGARKRLDAPLLQEALGCAMLQMMPDWSGSTIVRTRDEAELAKCDVVIDVGACVPLLHTSTFAGNDAHMYAYRCCLRSCQATVPRSGSAGTFSGASCRVGMTTISEHSLRPFLKSTMRLICPHVCNACAMYTNASLGCIDRAGRILYQALCLWTGARTPLSWHVHHLQVHNAFAGVQALWAVGALACTAPGNRRTERTAAGADARFRADVRQAGEGREDLAQVIYRKMYKGFVEEIDAIDNGINVAEGDLKYKINTHLSARAGQLNPGWHEVPAGLLKRFI